MSTDSATDIVPFMPPVVRTKRPVLKHDASNAGQRTFYLHSLEFNGVSAKFSLGDESMVIDWPVEIVDAASYSEHVVSEARMAETAGYSRAVEWSFRATAAFAMASVVATTFSWVLSVPILGIAGAGFLACATLSAVSWLSRAERERAGQE